MSRTKFLLKAAGIVLGGTGTVLCLAGIILVWIASNRLGQATERLFSSADRALIAVRQRVVRTQERIAVAKESAEDIEGSLLEWTKQDAGRREIIQRTAADKAAQLAHALEQADLWLEVADSSVGLIRESLASGTFASSTAASPLADRLIEEIASLRTQLAELSAVAARIQERISGAKSDSLEPRLEQVAPIAGRVSAGLGSMDARFRDIDQRLSATASQVQELGARVQWWLLFATIGTTALLLWMAAGQIALCWRAHLWLVAPADAVQGRDPS